MLTITKLKMWKDVNYTKRCVEVPPAGTTKLPAVVDYTLPAGESIRPRKYSTLTALELPIPYLSVMDMSYLYIEATDGTNSVKLYGWIDNIEETATSAESVRIDWTVDWWRSYSGVVSFNAGTITRCNDSTLKRPYGVNPRMKLYNSSVPIFPGLNTDTGQNNMWVIVLAVLTYTSGGDNISQLTRFIFPDGVNVYDTGSNTTYRSLSIQDCYNGYLDEVMTNMLPSIGADNIDLVSAYVSPIIPNTDITYDSAKMAWKSSYTMAHGTWQLQDWGMFWESNLNYDPEIFGSYTRSLGTSLLMTDDTHSYYVSDFEGNLMGVVPWGIGFNRIFANLDIGPIGGYMKVYLYDSSDSSNIAEKAISNGMAFSIPLPSIPITTNQWSDYVLSGQRNYDRQNREISREQSAVEGISGIGTSAVGALAGALIGGPIGAGVAGISASTAIGSLASTGINYWLSGIYNDKLNDLQDQLYSRQKNTIQETGYGEHWRTIATMNSMNGPMLVKLSIDAVSEAEMSGDITYNGYKVQVPVGSVSAYITAGGPLQVANLVITGSAPAVAKDYIKTMLENGVRIVENNPYGVSP